MAACGKESQTGETGVCVKGERFIQVPPPERKADSGPKDYLPFLLKPMVLRGIRRGGFLFSIQLSATFGHAGDPSFHLLTTQYKNLALCHLGQWGRQAPCSLSGLSGLSGSQGQGSCRTHCQEV